MTSSETETISPERILQTGLAFWASKTLLTAVELDLFTKLAERPSSAEDLRQRAGLHPRAALDFFDALVALGFLQRSGGVYSNTRETEIFLDQRKPSYVGGILEMANQRLFGFWNHLTDALRTGEPQNETRAGAASPFADLYRDPARLRSFLAAMSGVSRGANMAIAAKFPWKTYSTFVDAGTAQGDLAVQVALANPHLTGVGLDLPVVQPVFEEYAQQTGVADRLKFAAVDFFTGPLPKADVIMMGHILHDWDLAQKKMLIGKAFEAIPQGGAFIAYDSIIDDDRRQNAFGLLMSLNMLIETPAGFDYTGADCMRWMKEAGFTDTRVEHLIGPDSMVIGIK